MKLLGILARTFSRYRTLHDRVPITNEIVTPVSKVRVGAIQPEAKDGLLLLRGAGLGLGRRSRRRRGGRGGRGGYRCHDDDGLGEMFERGLESVGREKEGGGGQAEVKAMFGAPR